MAHPLYELEQRLGFGPVKTARFLGYSYATYAQYKNGRRDITPYLAEHLRALKIMPDTLLQQLSEEAPNGDV